MNQADAVATAPFRLMLNSDTIVPAGVITGCRDHLVDHPEVAGVGCRLLNPDGTHQSSVFRFPSIRGLTLNALYVSQAFPNHPVLNWDRYGFGDWNEVRPADVVMGSFLLLRRDVVPLDELLLDEGYFMYGEETDLCRRIVERGSRIEFHPGFEITHVHGGSSRTPAQLAWSEEAKRRGQLRFLLALASGSCRLVRESRPASGSRSAMVCLDRPRHRRSSARPWFDGPPASGGRRPFPSPGDPEAVGTRRALGRAALRGGDGVTIVLLTGDGPEHRYVANQLADEVGLAAVLVETGATLTPVQRFAQLRRRYSTSQLVSRFGLALYRRALNDRAAARAQIDAVLGPDGRTWRYPELNTMVETVNRPAAHDLVERLDPTRLLVYGTGIVGDRMLERSPLTPLNLHTGISPYYRGAACAFWPIHNGEPEMCGATVHEICSVVDGGPIYATAIADLEPGDGVHAVFARTVRAGAAIYAQVVSELGVTGGDPKGTPQDLGGT